MIPQTLRTDRASGGGGNVETVKEALRPHTLKSIKRGLRDIGQPLVYLSELSREETIQKIGACLDSSGLSRLLAAIGPGFSAGGVDPAFWCPYCKLWITDLIHRQDFHCDSDTPDEVRSALIRVDGVIYEDEEAYERAKT